MTRVCAFLLGTSNFGGISGGDRHALEVLSAWALAKDRDITLYVSSDGKEVLRRFKYAINSQVISHTGRGRKPLRLIYIWRCILGVIFVARHRPAAELFYATTSYFYDLIPAILARNRSARPSALLFSSLFHVIPPPWKRQGNALGNAVAWIEQSLMIWILARIADGIIVDNEDVKQELARRGISPRKILVSAMGVKQSRSDLPRRGAVYVGRLSDQKGIPTLLRAWRIAVRACPSDTLRLIGRNEGNFSIDKHLKEQELQGSVTVESDLNDGEVRQILASARLFVTASREEGYGLSVLEALATGTPAVTFDIPAFRAAFPYGRVAAVRLTPEALAETLIKLLTDDELYRTLSEETAALRWLSWPDVAQQLWAEGRVEARS